MSRCGMDSESDAVSSSGIVGSDDSDGSASGSGEIVCSSPIINRYGAIWE